MKNRSWIVLRGLARAAGHWGSFKDLLIEKFPNDEFEFLDLPGNGVRFDEESPLQISDYVHAIRSHSEFIRAGKKVHILSVSLGGMITVEWMRLFPDEVVKSYVMCTSSRNDAMFYERFRAINLWKSRGMLSFKRDDLKWEETILDMVANSHDRKKEELPRLLEVTKKYPMKKSNVFRQLLAASRYSFPDQAPGDIQLIGSYGDKLVDPKCTLRIAQRWGMEPIMHPWSGHDIAIDDPHWIIEQIL